MIRFHTIKKKIADLEKRIGVRTLSPREMTEEQLERIVRDTRGIPNDMPLTTDLIRDLRAHDLEQEKQNASR
jgi:hypothetical protein